LLLRLFGFSQMKPFTLNPDIDPWWDMFRTGIGSGAGLNREKPNSQRAGVLRPKTKTGGVSDDAGPAPNVANNRARDVCASL
jgi:hypothetical protein